MGHISGAHINPSVTLAFLVARRIHPLHAAGYMVAQVAGAIGAAAIVYVSSLHRILWNGTATTNSTNRRGHFLLYSYCYY